MGSLKSYVKLIHLSSNSVTTKTYMIQLYNRDGNDYTGFR